MRSELYIDQNDPQRVADLYDALANAYGKPPSMSRCDAACLPKPQAYSAAELANLSQRHGTIHMKRPKLHEGHLRAPTVECSDKQRIALRA